MYFGLEDETHLVRYEFEVKRHQKVLDALALQAIAFGDGLHDVKTLAQHRLFQAADGVSSPST